MPEHQTVARRYLRALESGDTEAVAALLHPEIVQVEYPNALNPQGQQRGYDALIAGAAAGAQLMRVQRFHVERVVEQGDLLVLELLWEGTLAQSLSGTMREGQTLRAHFALFLEFRDGLIVRQYNYDCFEPW